MKERTYLLRLVFEGPFLTHAVGTLGFGTDAAMQRYHGRPVIGGSLIRGNLRHAWNEFATLLAGDPEGRVLSDSIDRWLGAESREGDFEPNRAAADFDMFWKLAGDAGTAGAERHRHRIKIDPGTGQVEEGALQTIEDFCGAGAFPTFEGRLHARLEDDLDAEAFEGWVRKAVDYISAMGALKGAGFGRLSAAELSVMTPVWRLWKGHAKPADPDRFGIVLHLDQPFCVGRPRTNDTNLVEGEDQIPGSVLKAVIARALGNDADALEELFAINELIVTHAIPARAGAPIRGTALPLSLASFDGEVHDLALKDKPVLLQTRDGVLAPAFVPDWKGKDWKAAREAFGDIPSAPGRYLHVRTEIDSDSGVSKESRLFSQDCADPWGHVWCADLELGLIPPGERGRVCENLLRLFEQDLRGIGKTKARARVEVRSEPFGRSGRPRLLACGKFIVLLRTHARLLPAQLDCDGCNSDNYLCKRYQDYWKTASEGRLRLSHHFARERRVGGAFYWRHYRRHEAHYAPEWLTEAGSVFVVEPTGDGEAAADLLYDWGRFGLPPAADRKDENWRTDPYRRENGFGEIVVNHPAQLRLIELHRDVGYDLA